MTPVMMLTSESKKSIMMDLMKAELSNTLSNPSSPTSQGKVVSAHPAATDGGAFADEIRPGNAPPAADTETEPPLSTSTCPASIRRFRRADESGVLTVSAERRFAQPEGR